MIDTLHAQISNPTRITSAQGLASVGLSGQKNQADEVLDICTAAQRNGTKNLSLREIAKRWELLHGTRIDVGTVSARVSNLVSASRLVRVLADARPCTISGKTVQPVSVPMHNAPAPDIGVRHA